MTRSGTKLVEPNNPLQLSLPKPPQPIHKPSPLLSSATFCNPPPAQPSTTCPPPPPQPCTTSTSPRLHDSPLRKRYGPVGTEGQESFVSGRHPSRCGRLTHTTHRATNSIHIEEILFFHFLRSGGCGRPKNVGIDSTKAVLHSKLANA